MPAQMSGFAEFSGQKGQIGGDDPALDVLVDLSLWAVFQRSASTDQKSDHRWRGSGEAPSVSRAGRYPWYVVCGLDVTLLGQGEIRIFRGHPHCSLFGTIACELGLRVVGRQGAPACS